MGVAGGYRFELLAEHEHQMVWVVEAEVAALLETVIVLQYDLTFPALVATAELAVLHCSAVMAIALEFVLAWR